MYTAFHQTDDQTGELCVVLAGSEQEIASLAASLPERGVRVIAYDAKGHAEESDAVPGLLWQGKVDAIWFATGDGVTGFARRLKHDGGTLAMLDNVEVIVATAEVAQTAAALGLRVTAQTSDAADIEEAARARLVLA